MAGSTHSCREALTSDAAGFLTKEAWRYPYTLLRGKAVQG